MFYSGIKRLAAFLVVFALFFLLSSHSLFAFGRTFMKKRVWLSNRRWIRTRLVKHRYMRSKNKFQVNRKVYLRKRYLKKKRMYKRFPGSVKRYTGYKFRKIGGRIRFNYVR